MYMRIPSATCTASTAQRSNLSAQQVFRGILKIAGAGPSGLTAAICLAKAGYKVEVSEARETVGARFIGDFQILENGSGRGDFLEMLQKIGIATNFFVSPVHQATLFDYRLSSKTVSSDEPFCYFIKRGVPCLARHVAPAGGNAAAGQKVSLDHGLLQQALCAGVTIHYRKKVSEPEADIIATGPTSADGLAKEMTFLTDSADCVWVLFDQTLAPGGYAYLFVLGGEATFGCAITRDLPQVNRYFDKALKRFLEVAPFSISDAKTGYSFMDFSLKSSAIANQKLYVGEAGGFQDYLFGLGLRYAFLTGYFAATSFISSQNYDQLWQEGLGRSQEVSLVNRALYESGGNVGLSQFVKMAGDSPDFKKYLASWHAPSVWKRLLVPIVKRLWQRDLSRNRCIHPFETHWCRSRAVRQK